MKRVDDVGGETFVEEISKQVEMVVSGCFQSYFYILQGICHRADLPEQVIIPLQRVRNDKGVEQNLAFRVRDEAVVLILCNVDSSNDHGDHLHCFI